MEYSWLAMSLDYENNAAMKSHLFLKHQNWKLWPSSVPVKACYRLRNIDDYITTTNFDFWQLTKPITKRFMFSRISNVYILWSGFFQNDKRRFPYSFELYKYQGKMADCHARVHPITGSWTESWNPENQGAGHILSIFKYRDVDIKIFRNFSIK